MTILKKNIFSIIGQNLEKGEVFEKLVQNKDFKFERIISKGQISNENQWYDQEDNEWVILLQGEATIEFANKEKINLEAGDYILIPAHEKHKIIFTSSEPECIWLALHYK
ncbi:MAG: cupin domain-containing protein [Saprospiraceae bacterium]|nr:cupin domain-containing protein [Saprospiraceae bacterium]